mgnify:CR=1 FL=1
MGRRRRGNGWTKPKKRACVASSAAAPVDIAPLAPAGDVVLFEALPAAPIAEVVMSREHTPPPPSPIECAALPPPIECEMAPPSPLASESVAMPVTPPDDQVAARMRLWKRRTRRPVLFPFRSPTEFFRMVDMSRLSDEFMNMFLHGEDSWCELVMRWLRYQRQRVTLTFGHLRAAVAAGHRNVLKLVRHEFHVDAAAVPLVGEEVVEDGAIEHA